ncbi:hypothetical protein FACS189490_05290 [Clostridia bacterium]|nr:hypothetical protein FACS189490_05290 [Clostridia bacterium]
MDYMNMAFDQIAATIAHDVKNPLSIVRAGINVLETHPDEAESDKMYRVMKRELDKVNELLLEFIQYAKPNNIGRLELPFNGAIKGVIDEMGTPYRGQTQFSLTETGQFFISGDNGKLNRVFTNIIKNAVEANAKEIQVKIYDEKDFAVVKFYDDGDGITKDTEKKLSQPYFTTKQGGSGLGLSICKTIIAEHGGTFSIKARKRKGCVVTVKLPKI